MAQIRPGISMNLFGDKELNHFFKESLKFGQQRSIFIAGFRRAARPIVRTAKALFKARRKPPHQKGGVYSSIGVAPAKSRSPKLMVGARTFGQHKGHHAHFVDMGTDKRAYKNKQGTTVNTGRMPANYFWTDTLNQEEQNVKRLMSTEMLTALDKFVKRNVKRINKVA